MLKGIDKYLFYHVCNKHSCWIFRFILFYFWYVEFFRIFGKNKICPFQCWCCCSLCNLIFSIWFSHWWIVFKFFRLFFFRFSSTRALLTHTKIILFSDQNFSKPSQKVVCLWYIVVRIIPIHTERENERTRMEKYGKKVISSPILSYGYTNTCMMHICKTVHGFAFDSILSGISGDIFGYLCMRWYVGGHEWLHMRIPCQAAEMVTFLSFKTLWHSKCYSFCCCCCLFLVFLVSFLYNVTWYLL